MTKKIDGKHYSKPLNKNTCANCGKEFVTYLLIDGKWRGLHTRKNCLECLPYDCGKKSAQFNTIRKCTVCGKEHDSKRGKGSCKNFCGNCRSKREHLKKKKRGVEYKGGKCIVCGYKRCLRSLHFHHSDPDKKEFTIGNGNCLSLSWSKLKPELDKCILVCANCHGEIHDGMITVEGILHESQTSGREQNCRVE